jgi:GNAT superfamily N-acetyltransferase
MKKKPTDRAYRLLSQCLRDEEAIHGPRNTPVLLKERVDTGQAAYLQQDGEIIAFSAIWKTGHSDWVEQGTLWVRPDHRRKGLARKVKQKLYTLIPNDKSSFIITHNDAAVKMALSFGMIEASVGTWNIAPWDATCGKCDRFETEEEKRQCPLLADPKECRLFFKTQ